MNKSFLGYVVIIFALFVFSMMTLFKFNNTYNMLTKNTQLSAWSLTQMEVETIELDHQIDVYLLDQTASKKPLNLKFDVLWSRYKTFLTSDEMATVRNQYDSNATVHQAFAILKKHEKAVVEGDRVGIGKLKNDLAQILPKIRNLMIVNFTGQQSIEHRQIIQDTRTQIYWDMVFIFVVLTYLTIRHYKYNTYQQKMAWDDALTELKNRNYLFQLIKRFKKSQTPSTLVLFDINGFKDLNDTFGYPFGDRVLRTVSQALGELCTTPNMYCARVGGDEFAILIVKNQVNTKAMIKELEIELTKVLMTIDPTKKTSLSFGVASSHAMEDAYQYVKRSANLFNNADLALNIAKRQPTLHPSIVFYSQRIELEHRKKRQLTSELAKLIENKRQDELYMCFQPIIARHAPKLGCEALLRWNHPTYGFIDPQYIIQIAEEAGVAKRLGHWIMQQVYLALTQEWAEFSHRIEVSINLSDSLFDEDLPQVLSKIFASKGNYLESIVLEITETMTLDEVERSSAIIKKLEQLNIRMSLDDFGTGWSSLYNLNHLHFTKLKIDKSFVCDINSKQNQEYFVSAIVTLSHQLGIKVVAEGIEQLSQLNKLMELGVDEYQGYYFSKPITKQKFAKFCVQYFDVNSVSEIRHLH